MIAHGGGGVRIVCAACKHPDGRIVCGPRHMDYIMWAQILGWTPSEFAAQAESKGLPLLTDDHRQWGHRSEQGFIDQFGKFYTREEAWLIADAAGQIIESERNWQTGRLHHPHDRQRKTLPVSG
jgi:hypothetical protein